MAEGTVNNVNLFPDEAEEGQQSGGQQYGVDETEQRDNWTCRFDFLLSCLGWVVGLSNILSFPYLCYYHGGVVFLVVYSVMLILMGIPIFFLEISLGQFCSQGPLTCWKFSPLLKGIGVAQVIITTVVAIYQPIITALAFFYLFASCTATLPWNDCSATNAWINERCHNFTYRRQRAVFWHNATCYQHPVTDLDAFNKRSFKSAQLPSEQYFNHRVLRMSNGIDHIGGIQWDLALCLLAVWIISFLSLVKGIKSLSKVMYVTTILTYVILLTLLIRGVTLPGSLDGIVYFMTPDLSKIKESRFWYDAAIQVFFSLNLGLGNLIALASYNRFHNNCLRDALIVTIANWVTSIVASLVIFSFIGYMSLILQSEIRAIATSGLQLVFVLMPGIMTHLTIAPLWSALFFILLICVSFSTQLVYIQTVITGITDQFSWLRLHKIKLLALLCFLLFLIGLPLCTNAGIFILTLMDTYSVTWVSCLTVYLECMTIAYVYGARRFVRDIETMLGPCICLIWWRWCWKHWTPPYFMSVASSMFFSRIERARCGRPICPEWAEALGWCMAISSFIWIPTVPLIMVVRKTGSLPNRLRQMIKPETTWGPRLVKHRQLIKHVEGFIVDPYGNTDVSHMGANDNPAIDLSLIEIPEASNDVTLPAERND